MEFSPIYLPPFERFDNISPAMLHRGDAELVRFVDPADDQIAVLPPDATPQVARLFARYSDRRPSTEPWRVYYRQTIVRAGQQRGRTRRQRMHVGCENIGAPCPEGELDLVRTILAICEALGLRNLVFEIGHVGAAAAILADLREAGLSEDALARLRAAFRAKDLSDVASILDDGSHATAQKRARDLLAMHGADEVLLAARQLLPPLDLRTAQDCSKLAQLCSAISAVHFDFGDMSTISYYTGMRFSLHLPGLGEPIGSGGRYDKLLGQLGAQGLAIGFSFDVDNVDRALQLQRETTACMRQSDDAEEQRYERI